MRNMLHRNGKDTPGRSKTRMEIEFDYSLLGEKSTYLVSRTWTLTKTGVNENLSIKRNGQDLDDLSQSHWQEFLLELIPPGLAQLFFFDGEKIQRLAEEDSETEELARSIKSLLGLDMVERLQSDLKNYSTNKKFWAQEDALHLELMKIISEGEEYAEARRLCSEELGGLNLQREIKELNDIENDLLIKGGNFARERKVLTEKKIRLEETVNQLENDLREICSEILPLSLVPQLCAQLASSLKLEEKLERNNKTKEIGQKLIKRVENRVLKDSFWGKVGIKVSSLERGNISKNLLGDILDSTQNKESSSKASLIHNSTDASRKQLLSWIEQANDRGPKRSHEILTALEKTTRELQNVTRDLGRIPEKDSNQKLLDLIRAKEREIGIVQQKRKAIEEEILKKDRLILEKKRQEKNLNERIARSKKIDTKLQTLSRVRSVLETYSEKLLKNKVKFLQDSITYSFQRLARKEDMVRSISINPESFRVTLEDRFGRKIPKAQLSAGEKQIYAISLLWGLGQASGRPLPVMIDTPLGRLDSDHRDHLVDRYFPFASHQVILFSTDTEIDQRYLKELSQYISHPYHIQFDDTLGQSVVDEGYFWSSQNEALN